jgi:hypothetical protein
VKSRRSCAALAIAVACVFASAGCSSDDGSEPGAGDPTTSSSTPDGSSSPTPSGSPEGSSESATGQEMSSEFLTLHLPADQAWEVDSDGESATFEPADDDPWDIHLGSAGSAGDDDLESLATALVQVRKAVYPTARRQDDRTVGGLEGVVVAAEDDRGYYFEFATVSRGETVTVNFSLPRKDAAARALIDAVLASVEWK